MNDLITGLLLGFLLLGGVLLSVCRYGFTTLRFTHLESFYQQYPKQAIILRKLMTRENHVMSSLLFGSVWLFCLTTAILITVIFPAFSDKNLVFCSFLATAFLWLVTESLPKAYIQKNNQKYFFILPSIIQFCFWVFYIPSRFLEIIIRSFTNFFPGIFYPLNSLVAFEGNSKSQLGDSERGMRTNLFDQPVTNFMIPALKLDFINADITTGELLEKVFNSNIERYVMHEGSKDNIIGVLHTKMIIKSFGFSAADKDTLDIASALSEPEFLFETVTLKELVHYFRQKNNHFVLLQNQKNQLTGAITSDIITKIILSNFI